MTYINPPDNMNPIARRRHGVAIALLLVMAALCPPAAAGDGGSLRPASMSAAEQAVPATAIPSTLIELDGTISSSPDGSELEYNWTQVSGPKVELSDYSSPKPYFRTHEPGIYEFELVVSANGLDSEPHLVRLEIERENLPPVAKVAPEVWGQVGKALEIDAGESFDPEGEKLTYRWRPLTPGLSLPPSALSLPVLSFEPVADGVFEIELVVSDGEKHSDAAVVRLNIKPRPLPPVARVKINTLEVPASPVQELAAMSPPAGPRPDARIEAPAVVKSGEPVMLDGRRSRGSNGSRLEYFWKQKSGAFISDFELVFDGAAERFKAPRPGDYEFELVVSDNGIDSAPVYHRLRVVQEADPPVAVVVAPSRAMPGSLVRMDATQSYDMEGSRLVYRWRQTGGPKVNNYVIDEKLSDAAPAFYPPKSGIYSFELIVSNGKLNSKPVEIDIEVGEARLPPTLSVGGPQVARVGEQVFFEAGTDAAERGLRFAWRQTEGPASALMPGAGGRAVVTPPVAGRYVFEVSAAENGQIVATAKRTLEVFNVGAGAVSVPALNPGALPDQPLPSAQSKAPALITPPIPVNNGVPASQPRRRVPELTPLPNTGPAPAITATFPQPTLPPAQTGAPSSGRTPVPAQNGGRAAARVMTGNRTPSPPQIDFP